MEKGVRIRFEYEGSSMEGLVIQVRDGEANIKLDSGYNIVVPEKSLKNVTEMKGPSKENDSPPTYEEDPSLPRITILHTGGTIASKVDYDTGAVSTHFSNEDLLAMFPELKRIANIDSVFVRNMWSQDLRFAHWNILAEEVKRHSDSAGIIVTSGTDFLHYTAAALSFALEGLSIPVMVVGSQRSSDRGSSDAATNLTGAARFITENGNPGVFVAMHETTNDEPIAIIDGLHARKMHSSRRDAFRSVNAPLVARVGKSVDILDDARLRMWKDRAGDLRVRPFNEDLKIGWWKTHPQAQLDELDVYDSYDGLIMEGSGLGHGPTSTIDEETKIHTKIRERIGELAGKIPVCMAVQTIYGAVSMNVYKPQRELLDLGVLGNELDMMPEVAFVKLAWLLSNYPEDVPRLYAENVRGEISEVSPMEPLHES